MTMFQIFFSIIFLDERSHPPTTGETTALLATGPPSIFLGDLYDGSHIILAMDLQQGEESQIVLKEMVTKIVRKYSV